MAQVTYRGVKYDTANRPNQVQPQSDKLTYRGAPVVKEAK